MRYLALGDSYTIGEGVDRSETWPTQLTALVRARGIPLAEPVVVAQTGWTTDELQAGIEEADPKSLFAFVSLLIGVNDQYRGGNAETYRAGFRTLLRRAIAFAGGDRRVVVLSIPDWGVTPFAQDRDRDRIAAEIDRFNAVNQEETERAGAHYVDVTAESRRATGDPALITTDGLHPSARAYETWAQLVLPVALAALSGSIQPTGAENND